MATRRARAGKEHDLKTGLAELAAGLKQTATEPTHLGNFDSHVQTAAGEPARPGDEPEPEELEAGAEAGEETDLEDFDEEQGVEAGGEDLEDADTAPDSDSPPESDEALSPAQQLWETDRANMNARLENQERELQFLRQGQQAQAPTPPVNPLAEIPLPFQVTEADVQELMQGGPNAVQILNRALQLTATATAQHTATVLSNAYTQARANETGSENAVQSFYQANPDLVDFPEVVQSQANAVWSEYPHAPNASKLEEVARRCRGRLKDWGLDKPRRGKPRGGKKTAGAASKQGATTTARMRPAMAEMGGRGSRGNGRSSLTAQEKEMYELIP
jgi:hypothetical protein